ncbi:MAG: hydroxylamine oxidoreductase [Gemmatimonadetes bacterium]|nr:hydroxylamine oxidoreductase [Gemmatimonadota bacterium]
MEVTRRAEEAGLKEAHVNAPASSQQCVQCHEQSNPGIISHWKGSTHAEKGVGCYECHQADEADADGFEHFGKLIATVVTPRDCSRCHITEAAEFQKSHHSKAGNILASLDNFLAEVVEGARVDFNPHSPTPGRETQMVNGGASAFSGCQQCHGAKVALTGTDGSMITVDQLAPDEDGHPTNQDAVALILKDKDGKPKFHPSTWPNTGIGRLNLDGSRGSCSACHSRHDFSPRRARQPENCGKCHLGPDHPQKEIYEESKHGVAYRDLKDDMNLDAAHWVLGEDYAQAPTCATCHMSGHSRNEGKVTHDPGERISWTNRPPISVHMDTDINGQIVKETDPAKRAALVADSWQEKRGRMKQVCSHCHTSDYVDSFYTQYDDLVVLYNEKFAKPGQDIMAALMTQGLRTATQFDEEIEWTWFYLWHHEGRRARHGASMMAPDYTHWHGMYEVAERFYMELIPQAREMAEHAGGEQGQAVNDVIDALLARPEHVWFQEGAAEQAALIREQMERRYGQGERRQGGQN